MKKSWENVWWFQKKAVTLHRLSETTLFDILIQSKRVGTYLS